MADPGRKKPIIVSIETVHGDFTDLFSRRSFVRLLNLEPNKRLAENDDGSERLARRRSSLAVDNRRSSEFSPRRVSIGVAGRISAEEIMQHYHKCVKLHIENKINSKNAFALSIIDYMAVLNRRDRFTNDMQTASTGLDISAKVYGVRVDCVHTHVFKMAADSGKKNTDDNEENRVEKNNTSLLEEPQVVRKRKSRLHNILVSAESLSGTPELLNLQPLDTNTDSQTTDKLLQVTLPCHASSGHSLHFYEDVLLDSAPTETMEIERTRQEVPMPSFPDLDDLHICPMFADFRMLDWTEDDIPSSPGWNKSPTGDNLRFDMDAPLPDAGDYVNEGMNFFNLEDASQEHIDGCVRRPEQTEYIVDFRESVVATEKDGTYSEYSYLRKTHCYLHWAGPAHWNPTLFPKVPNSSNVAEPRPQKAVRKKKDMELIFKVPEAQKIFDCLEIKSDKKLQMRTLRQVWNEDKLTLPEDVHYDSRILTKFYFHSSRIKHLLCEGQQQAEPDAVSLEDEGNYDYANENDMENYSLQPNNPDEFDDVFPTQEPGHPDNQMCTQIFTGDNPGAPSTSTAQIRMNYSTRTKKVDMRHLKNALWETITLENTVQVENEEGTNEAAVQIKDECSFVEAYERLPTLLGTENAESVSPALAFLSVLHLANDKTLQLKSNSDMSDVKISQG